MTPRRTPPMLLIALLTVLAARPGAAELPAPLDQDIWSMMSADAAAYLAVPSLKRATNQAQDALEAMDRDELLLGGRPLDQVQSYLGIHSHVDDFGAAAVAWVPGDAGGWRTVWIVSVTNVDDFLEANFDAPDETGARTRGDGVSFFARSIESYVLLSRDQSAVEGYTPDDTRPAAIASTLGDAGVDVARRGEVVMYFRPDFMPVLLRRSRLAGTAVGTSLARLESSMRAGVLVMDFDPLALVLRGYASMSTESSATNGAAPVREPLKHVGDGAHLLAASVDVRHLRGLPWFASLRDGHETSALDRIDAIEVSRPAGGDGRALLSHATMWLSTPTPAALVEAWTDPATPGETTLASVTGDLPAGVASLLPLLCGDPSCRMQVASSSTGLTLSAPDAVTGSGRLAENGMIRAMVSWLPPTPSVVVFSSVSAVVTWARPWATVLPGMDVSKWLPPVDPNVPPLAFGVGATGSGIEATLIVPAGVLQGMFDHVADRVSR